MSSTLTLEERLDFLEQKVDLLEAMINTVSEIAKIPGPMGPAGPQGIPGTPGLNADMDFARIATYIKILADQLHNGVIDKVRMDSLYTMLCSADKESHELAIEIINSKIR